MSAPFLNRGALPYHADLPRGNSQIQSDFSRTSLPQRPPQMDDDSPLVHDVAQDWIWLYLNSERGFTSTLKKSNEPSRRVAETLGKFFAMEKFSCFVPRAVLEAIVDDKIRYSDDFDVVVDKCSAAVVFCDASGFTAVTEALDRQIDGAERLGDCINDFFGGLIQVIHFWGGDIIKFAGDAVTIVWGCDDDNASDDDGSEPSSRYIIDRTKACQLACQCCLDLHRNLNGFDAGVDDKKFTLHIGVGFGKITILQVGGILDRWEYVVAGPPIEQISIAEPLASSGETVLSPCVVEALGGSEAAVIEEIPGENGYARMYSLKGPKISAPPPLERIVLSDDSVELLRRFIPPAIFKRLASGYTVFTNEIRQLSVVFVSIKGLDVSTDVGPDQAQRLMLFAQKNAYIMEGSVNKFSVDDKGCVILLMFGLPPVWHYDDPIRAILTSVRIIDGLRNLGLAGGIGVATGRVWVGTIGTDIRKEYTALGDTVNTAARLMQRAAAGQVLTDQETVEQCKHALQFVPLGAVSMKGKAQPVALFKPAPNLLKPPDIYSLIQPMVVSWPEWKYAQDLSRALLPEFRYRPFVFGLDQPPLDGPRKFGPVFPWELAEPWLPSLKSSIDLGGVMMIKGKEVDGTFELIHQLKTIGEASGRNVFICSNMPESSGLPISNVPLLAWRKLCTEMVWKWRKSPARIRRGIARIDPDNSVYGLAKELLHPVFHWRLSTMKGVIHNLELPRQIKENQPLEKFNHRYKDGSPPVQSKRATLWSKLTSRSQVPKPQAPKKSNPNVEPEPFTFDETFNNPSAVVPAICSLINGYTMHEQTILCLHVRSGSCLFASMDAESWKVLELVARMAMLRRRRRIELELQALRKWRRKHSVLCPHCKGLGIYRNANGDLVKPKWTSRCRPPPNRYFPPFTVVFVSSEVNDKRAEQSQLARWAHECGMFLQLQKLTLDDTASFLAHIFGCYPDNIPDELAEYVHRVSAGNILYVYRTALQLIHFEAILPREIPASERLARQPPNTPPSLQLGLNHKRLIKEERERLFPTCTGLLCAYRSIGPDLRIAQLKGLHIKRSLTKMGGFWLKIRDADNRSLAYQGDQMPTVQENAIPPFDLDHDMLASDESMWENEVKRKRYYFLPPGPAEYCGKEEIFSLRSKIMGEGQLELSVWKYPRRQEILEKCQARIRRGSNAIPRPCLITMQVDLSTIPYIPQLRAATMLLIEGLEPDEQLVAKAASVFTTPFCFYELAGVYPRNVPPDVLDNILSVLLGRDLLEVCGPPGPEAVKEERFTKALEAFEEFRRRRSQAEGAEAEGVGDMESVCSSPSEADEKVVVVLAEPRGAYRQISRTERIRRASVEPAVTEFQDCEYLIDSEGSPAERQSFETETQHAREAHEYTETDTQDSDDLIRPTLFGTNDFGTRKPHTARMIALWKLELLAHAPEQRSVAVRSVRSALQQCAQLRHQCGDQDADQQSGDGDGDGRQEGEDGSSQGDRRQQGDDRSSGADFSSNGDDSSDASQRVQELFEEIAQETVYGIKPDGSPIFYRFTSTAFQHVLADLLTSVEREHLATKADVIVAMRIFYGLPFLISRVRLRAVQAAVTQRQMLEQLEASQKSMDA